MSGPIYNLFIVRGYKEAYYQLSKEEQGRFWDRVGKIGDDAGARVILICYSRWGSESSAGWGIEEYPDLAAVQKNARGNEENQHYRYLDAQSILGVRWEGDEAGQVTFANPIYQLFMFNSNNPAYLGLPREERERVTRQALDAIPKHGGVSLISCDCAWSNEEYSTFGAIAWPSLEAEQAFYEELQAGDWFANTAASRTILGTAWE